MRIAVFSAELVVGEALACALDQNGDFEVVAIDLHLRSAAAVIDIQAPDLVLVTEDAMDGPGLEALRVIRAEQGVRTVLIYAGALPDSNTARAFDALHSGTMGVFPLCQRLRLLAPVLQARPAPPSPLLGPAFEIESAPQLRELTPREYEVALLISEGLTNQQIGDRMGVTKPTVKVYMGRLFRTFDCQNRVQLALKLSSLGVTDSPALAAQHH